MGLLEQDPEEWYVRMRKIARHEGLPTTLRYVDGQFPMECVFDALRGEAGLERAIAILERAEHLEWAWIFAHQFGDLTEAHIERLLGIVLDRPDRVPIARFLKVRGLSESQQERIIDAVVARPGVLELSHFSFWREPTGSQVAKLDARFGKRGRWH